MRIERNNRNVRFDEVRKGDFFEWFGDAYLKIRPSTEADNTYNCTSNVLTTFENDTEVKLLNAKVVIE